MAHRTVARLINVLGIESVRHGKHFITTIPDDSAGKPLDLVNREFMAQQPNQLWVVDVTLCRHSVRLCLRGICHRCLLTKNR